MTINASIFCLDKTVKILKSRKYQGENLVTFFRTSRIWSLVWLTTIKFLQFVFYLKKFNKSLVETIPQDRCRKEKQNKKNPKNNPATQSLKQSVHASDNILQLLMWLHRLRSVVWNLCSLHKYTSRLQSIKNCVYLIEKQYRITFSIQKIL